MKSTHWMLMLSGILLLFVCASTFYHRVMRVERGRMPAEEAMDIAEEMRSDEGSDSNTAWVTLSQGTNGRISFETVLANADDICEKTVAFGYNKDKCAHGIGHVLLRRSQRVLKDGLSACGSAFGSQVLSFHCATGVYMEHIFAMSDSELNGDHLLMPCEEQTQYVSGCYRYIMRKMVWKKGRAVREAMMNRCRQLTDYHRLGCYHGYGFSYAVVLVRNPMLLKVACSEGTESERKMCIDGAIGRAIQLNKIDIAHKACESLDVLRDYCNDTVTNGITSDKHDYSLYVSAN